ncbi:MAG: HTH domain-containing protein [Clostridiales bacterium]|nr:HTH domain-containing protein [Clostridiales bacterium]
MEQPMYEEMLRKRDNITYSWEGQKSKYAITDIDQTAFKSYLKKAKKVGRISFENEEPSEVMTKLGLADNEDLLNAGAALFVNCGINELQMAKFASDERLTFTDIRRFTGSILDLADKAVQYIIDAMDWRVEFDGSLERKEIPEMFIREIRKPIRRNPLITRTLYYSKDMESFATGLKRIQDACDEADCKVEYYGDEYGFTVRFYRHCGEGWGTDMGANGTHGTQNGTHSDTSYEEQILNLVRMNNKITRKQMAKTLSISPRTVQRVINSMDNLIYIGSGKGGHWEIKN